jgi:heme iron utilization protein
MVICRKDFCKKIKSITDETHFAVLATESNGHPYTNLVGFLLSKDLKNLYFFTSKNTRKYRNILNNPEVCLLIDTRDKFPDKTYLITAITLIGKAEIMEDMPGSVVDMYLEKNAELKDFTESSSNVLVRVNITRYILVDRFQEVTEMEVAGI